MGGKASSSPRQAIESDRRLVPGILRVMSELGCASNAVSHDMERIAIAALLQV